MHGVIRIEGCASADQEMSRTLRCKWYSNATSPVCGIDQFTTCQWLKSNYVTDCSTCIWLYCLVLEQLSRKYHKTGEWSSYVVCMPAIISVLQYYVLRYFCFDFVWLMQAVVLQRGYFCTVYRKKGTAYIFWVENEPLDLNLWNVDHLRGFVDAVDWLFWKVFVIKYSLQMMTSVGDTAYSQHSAVRWWCLSEYLSSCVAVKGRHFGQYCIFLAA